MIVKDEGLQHSQPGMSVRRRSRDPNRFADEDERTHSSHQRSRAPGSTWKYLALIFVTFLAGTIVLYWLGWQPNKLHRLFLAQHGRDEDDYVLHPKIHINRPTATVEHRWRITKELRRPDGVLKTVYCINGRFPGPTLEARSGDRLIVEMENGLEHEGVSMHWHGLSMRDANSMDGAVGITQNPIEPGASFTYNFTIGSNEHGTFWYHAHEQVQRGDGLYGGLVVHDPSATDDAVLDERLLLVGDWYHRTAEEALTFYMHPGSFGNEPVPDSILLNGQGSFNCDNAVPARPLDCKQRTRAQLSGISLRSEDPTLFRIVNVGSYAGIKFSISDAHLTPVRVDGGHTISGQPAKAIGYLHPGERIDVMVGSTTMMSGTESSLRLTLDTSLFKYPNPSLISTQEFPLLWKDSSSGALSESKGVLNLFDLGNIKSAQDQSAILPATADKTIVLYAITQKLSHLRNEPRGFINNTSWRPQVEPTSPLLSLQREQWDKNQLVPRVQYSPAEPLWIDIVLNNLDEEDHPFHLHGYKVWVLSKYSSTYNWGSYNPFEDDEAPGGEYDLVHAVKKDTILVPKRGYAVLRAQMDNPGIWMFHCHNVSLERSPSSYINGPNNSHTLLQLWHQASGMAMAFEVS